MTAPLQLTPHAAVEVFELARLTTARSHEEQAALVAFGQALDAAGGTGFEAGAVSSWDPS